MQITREEVDRIASLSMLELDESESTRARQNLSDILEHAQRLNELDTEGVEPTAYILAQRNMFRPDVPSEDWTREELLQNAPAQEDGCFVVPKVVD